MRLNPDEGARGLKRWLVVGSPCGHSLPVADEGDDSQGSELTLAEPPNKVVSQLFRGYVFETIADQRVCQVIVAVGRLDEAAMRTVADVMSQRRA